ncbi:MAG: hypothetical protein LBU32_01525 [Clostridiales bacterium]|nr:hypothetical protein [Clostridiales bacterium]
MACTRALRGGRLLGNYFYADLHMKLPVLELDRTASAIDICISRPGIGQSSFRTGEFDCKSV